MSAEKIFPWVTMEDVALFNQKFEAARKSYLLDKYLNTVAYCTAALRLNPNNAKNIRGCLQILTVTVLFPPDFVAARLVIRKNSSSHHDFEFTNTL